MTFSHVRLLDEASEDTARFYRDSLGVPITWGEPGEDYVHFAAGNAEFALFNAAHQIHAAAADRFVMVFSTENLDQAVAALREKGLEVTPIEDRPDWGIRVAYTRDPQGHLVEINESIPMHA